MSFFGSSSFDGGNSSSSDFGGSSSESVNKVTFFSHVFNFENESKTEIVNLIQYSLLAIIPIIFLNKSIQRFIPEANPDKGSFEILAEVVVQVVVIFVGMILIHRMITFIPTYSQGRYEHVNILNIGIGFLIILMSIQSKLGVKVNILVDRLYELWSGESAANSKSSPSSKRAGATTADGVRVSQPISGVVPQHFPSRSDTMPSTQGFVTMRGTTNLDDLPRGPSAAPALAGPGAFEPMPSNGLGDPFAGVWG